MNSLPLKTILITAICIITFAGVSYYHAAHAQNPRGGAPNTARGNATNDLMQLYTPPKSDEQLGYDKPHRTADELANWLSGVIMNSLDIEAKTPKEDVKKTREFFSKYAYREYLTFLSEQSYWLFITKRKYNMNAASTRLPALLCKKAENGLYTWVFEVPVIINLMETPETPNARGKNAQEVVNLRIRVVRVPRMALTEGNPHQVLIENWSLQDDSAILNNDVEGCM